MIENLVTHIEEICCICLEQIEKFNQGNHTTVCCKNYIHKSCILTWIIYNCKIECCLCRSNKIHILVEDIISYDINNIKEYNINKDTFISNLNQIINELSGNESIIIQINEVDDDILTIHSNSGFLRRKKFKDLLTLILIPVFYIILFFILPYIQKTK
jgi:hypothetical protein